MKYLILLAIIFIIYRFWIMPSLKKANDPSISNGQSPMNEKQYREKPKVGEYIDYEEIDRK